MSELVIKKCKKCGALVKVIEDCTCENCGIKCCGEEMQRLEANTVDAAAEKHIPEYEVQGDIIKVSVNHVMEPEHHIDWIVMVTEDRNCFVDLTGKDKAEATFNYTPGAKIYAYCNLHELWGTEVK